MATQVKELHLYDTFDKKDRIKAIVKAIANSEAVPLKKLSLSNVNLKFVGSRWLARMATKVEELYLNTQYMGKEEARAILGAIAVGPEKLKQLTITNGRYWLDFVDADVLAHAANRLECFQVYDSRLSQFKIRKILIKALEGTRLKKLNLSGQKQFLETMLISQAEQFIPSISFHLYAEVYASYSESGSESDNSDLQSSESDSDSDSDSYSESDFD